ncbi:MAG: hypothetical protein ACE5FL_00465 [Myxococcota bacterium]
MESLAKLSFVATSLVMLTVGGRLLWAWRRTRAVPELAIGLAYSLGMVGLFLTIAMTHRTLAGHDVFGAWYAGHCGIVLGQATLILGVWRIFRPNSARAAATAWTAVAVCAATMGWTFFRDEAYVYTEVDSYLLLTTAISVFSYSWIAGESLWYASQLNRRRALGLSDSLTVARFVLWGFGGGSVVVVSLLSIFSVAAYGEGLSHVPWIFMLTQGMLVISCTSTWFAFFPPVFYRRLFEASDQHVTA